MYLSTKPCISILPTHWKRCLSLRPKAPDSQSKRLGSRTEICSETHWIVLGRICIRNDISMKKPNKRMTMMYWSCSKTSTSEDKKRGSLTRHVSLLQQITTQCAKSQSYCGALVRAKGAENTSCLFRFSVFSCVPNKRSQQVLNRMSTRKHNKRGERDRKPVSRELDETASQSWKRTPPFSIGIKNSIDSRVLVFLCGIVTTTNRPRAGRFSEVNWLGRRKSCSVRCRRSIKDQARREQADFFHPRTSSPGSDWVAGRNDHQSAESMVVPAPRSGLYLIMLLCAANTSILLRKAGKSLDGNEKLRLKTVFVSVPANAIVELSHGWRWVTDFYPLLKQFAQLLS